MEAICRKNKSTRSPERRRFVDVVGAAAVAYGVPTAMIAGFTGFNDDLRQAWTAATQASTRTRGTVAAKDAALKIMKAAAKNMVSIIQGTPGVTDQMKIDAGLTVRKTKPTPKPVPGQAPVLTIAAVNGRTVTLRLRQDGSKRAKPADAAFATVLTATGETRPLSMDLFQFACNTTQTTVDVPFGPSATGDTVWITAFWTNSRGMTGAAATPMSVSLPAGGAIQTTQPKIRIARAA